MKISVGSKNPVKIAAVKSAAEKVWEKVEIFSVDVPHGVSDMPHSDKESIEGAMNRARLSLEKTGADIGIGLEGHIKETDHGMMMSGFVVAIDKDERIGIGDSGGFLLPEAIAEEVRAGKELGVVMDKFTKVDNSKQKLGATGFFTDGIVPRKDAFERGVLFALTRFIRPELFSKR